MPIGGSNIGWDAGQPADTENAGLGDDRIRSLKTSVQEALDNEHNFPSGGGPVPGITASGPPDHSTSRRARYPPVGRMPGWLSPATRAACFTSGPAGRVSSGGRLFSRRVPTRERFLSVITGPQSLDEHLLVLWAHSMSPFPTLGLAGVPSFLSAS